MITYHKIDLTLGYFQNQYNVEKTIKPAVKIIGAGFSGLSLAFFLNKEGFNVEVYEKENHPGGMIRSEKSKYGYFESAANGFMGDANVIQFFSDNQIHFTPSSKLANKRFILKNLKPTRWPLNIFESLNLFFCVIKNFILNKINPNDFKNISVEKWGLEKLTPQTVNYLLSPALQGIYAGDIKKLSAKLILSGLFSKNKPKKIYALASGKNGIADITDQLEKSLKAKGVVFNYNFLDSDRLIADSLSQQQPLVIATSVTQAGVLLQPFKQDLQTYINFLAAVETLPLVTTTAFFKKKPDTKYLGFGVLFPRAENSFRALGVLMNNLIFSRELADHSETWIFGGAMDLQSIKMSDEDLKQEILKTRKIIFNSEEPILDLKITRWENALPYYNLQLENLLLNFKQHKNIFLHGNYLGAIGLSKILVASQKLATQIKMQFKD